MAWQNKELLNPSPHNRAYDWADMCCLPHSKARFYYSTHKLNYSRTQLFTNLITHELTNSQTYILTNLITHELTNSITHKLTNLKSYNIFYKTHVASHSLLAKKKPKNKQIGVIFSLTCFFFCPFFGILPAFCTILPF